MRDVVSNIARTAVPGVLAGMTRISGRAGHGTRVLMYHRVSDDLEADILNVSPALFRLHMKTLSRYADVVPLSQVLRNDAEPQREGRPRVAITFDDGYIDNLTNAAPILEEFNFPATVFLTTLFCEQYEKHSRYAHIRGKLHMAWQDIRRWLNQPGLEIGSHSLSHANLPLLSDDVAKREILQSRKLLRAETGTEVAFFAFPNGHYGQRELDLCGEAEYRGALTINPGRYRPGDNLFEIPRTEINFKDTELALRNKLLGGFDLQHRYLHWRRKRDFAASVK